MNMVFKCRLQTTSSPQNFETLNCIKSHVTTGHYMKLGTVTTTILEALYLMWGS